MVLTGNGGPALDGRLDGTEARRVTDQLYLNAQLVGCGSASGNVEGDDAAEAR
jgi:hypothetical protein